MKELYSIVSEAILKLWNPNKWLERKENWTVHKSRENDLWINWIAHVKRVSEQESTCSISISDARSNDRREKVQNHRDEITKWRNLFDKYMATNSHSMHISHTYSRTAHIKEIDGRKRASNRSMNRIPHTLWVVVSQWISIHST